MASDIESPVEFANRLQGPWVTAHTRLEIAAAIEERDAIIAARAAEQARASRDNEWRVAWSGSSALGPQGPHEVQEFLKGRDAVTRAVAYEHVAKAFANMPAVAVAIRQLAERTDANDDE